jgi:hypothetical protein
MATEPDVDAAASFDVSRLALPSILAIVFAVLLCLTTRASFGTAHSALVLLRWATWHLFSAVLVVPLQATLCYIGGRLPGREDFRRQSTAAGTLREGGGEEWRRVRWLQACGGCAAQSRADEQEAAETGAT